MTATATRTPPDHGTYARDADYRARDAARNRNKRRLIAYGRWNLWTDAGPVRDHIAVLGAHGIGWGRAASLAGLHRATVDHWLHGHRSYPPPARIKTELAERMLAVKPALDNIADQALVDATGAVRRLQSLVAAGFPAKHLALRLDMNTSDTPRLLRRPVMRAATARAVYALFDELRDASPADHGVVAYVAVRARNLARRNGWPTAADWDGEIDNPDADPLAWARDGREQQAAESVVEDAEFIVATDRATWQHAAERLDVDVNTLHTYRSRVQKRTAAAAGGAA